MRGTLSRLVVFTGLVAIAASATAQTTDCTSALFSTVPCSSQHMQDSTTGQNQDIQNGTDSTANRSSQQPDNTQVYVDSAGNRWDRLTAATDRKPVQFPPDPITDMQKLARSSTGETLPVFGRNFFQRAPSTFAPADEIPVTSDYVVGPGDEILVRMWGAEQTTGNSQLTVDTAGNIYVPRVGSVHVAGLRVNDLQSHISAEINRVFRNYRISVSLGHLRSIQIYVVGEARRPGAYTISALSTLLNALFASGGPSVQGSMRHIQVRRGSQPLAELDLYDLILKGDKSHDIRLESGDTIFIPPVGPQVALAGSVRRPALYELSDDAAGGAGTSLAGLLQLAGGFSATANTEQIRLERIDSNQQRHAVTLSLNAGGREMRLQDGDILYANHIELGFSKTITIRGNLANPGRFAWHAGMKLSDIIPDRESLLTGDYWRERNRMGVPTPLFEPYEFNTPLAVDSGVRIDSTLTRSDSNGSEPGNRSALTALTAVQPPSVPGQQQQQQQAGLAGGGVVSSAASEMDRNAMTEAGLTNQSRTATGNISNDSTDTNSDTNYNTSSNNTTGTRTLRNTQHQDVLLKQMQPQRPVLATLPQNVIRIPAPDIDWSYAVIERLDPKTLKTSLVPFNLGRLVQDQDASQNLELQPGDVVTIMNQRDILVPQHEQTKFIRLEGEFAGAGVYSANPGETLVDLVRRAGGLTPNAYLYGSSFQRESTRAFQQERLDEYITQLSADMDRQTAVRGASTSSGVSDPNALLLERNLVAQLRQLRATGRIVMDFSPSSEGVDSLPAIPLENGDVFRVPSRPTTVNVIGAVYGQNVFLYDGKRHLSDYLSLAGRATQSADTNHAFIIRADGSVFSRERAKGILSNHFDESRIFPGDSIVIPQKPIKPDATRRLLDYSQILSSFGLAIAAINVIK